MNNKINTFLLALITVAIVYNQLFRPVANYLQWERIKLPGASKRY